MSKIVLKFSILFFVVTSGLFASTVSKEECLKKDDSFIFAGGECIEFFISEGDIEDKLNIIVHGTWDEGTNTLGRYAPFAESLSMATDITSIAISLPGYSKSSSNKFTSLAHKGVKNLGAKKEYILFLGEVIEALKNKYKAKSITYIGHSAGAMMGATLSGLKPKLINNIALAGGRYDLSNEKKDNLISMVDVIDKINKDMSILFIYGTKDEISKPNVTKDFYKIAINKGLNAKLIKVEDAGHIDLDMSDTSIEAITEMLEE